MTALPVKGAVLQWARKFRGFSEREAAERLGISVSELRAYELDDLAVTLGAFENFAAKYRLPQATLFSLTPPDEPPKPQDFRTIEGRKAQQSFEFGVALTNVRTWLSQYKRLAVEDDEFEAPTLPLIFIDEKPEVAGERERKRLGISPEAQLGWPRHEAFRRWRASLEVRGIIVFQQKFPMADCKGFTLYETEGAPTIIINKTEELDVAKIFTLAHEYCHLLLRQPGISNENFDNPVEAFCNKFAAAFLIPTDVLRLVLPYWPNQPVTWKREHIDGWAARLNVSRIALALRLEQLELAPDGFHLKFKTRRTKTKTPPPRGAGGPDPTITQLSDIGGAYTKKIMGAMDRRLIDETHAAEALGLSVENFGKARAAILRHGELAIGG
jgi:Zn-dependent peptidase ImmA (M78 family)/transcriptional regulator with XRE-family HTH domain